MSELPEGWVWSTCGEVGDVQLGRQRSPKWHTGDHMRPYLRVANVFEDRIDLADVMEMDFPPEQYERFRLEPGDILLNEGQSPEWVGRPAMYRGELPGACFTNSLIRFRPYPGIDGKFALLLFRHHLHSRRFMREARITTNIAHLSSTRFAGVEFPVPPLAEQRRIVAAVERHFSRLDAADSSLQAAVVCASALSDAGYQAILRQPGELVRLGDVCETSSGGTPSRRRPEFYEGSIPWIKSGELRDGIVGDTEERISEEAIAGSSAKMVPGNTILIAMYGATIGKMGRTPSGGAATNQAIAAFFPGQDLTDEYLWAVLRAKRRELKRSGKGGAQPNISQTVLRDLVFPLPDRESQLFAARSAREAEETASKIRGDLIGALRRSNSLRRSVLTAAFSGRLVPQDPTEEPASLLLERIAAQRAAMRTTRRKKAAS